MNASATSVGGWPTTTLKKYLDEVFIYKLPEELQKVIILTKTISDHEKKSGETNFISENDGVIKWSMIQLIM